MINIQSHSEKTEVNHFSIEESLIHHLIIKTTTMNQFGLFNGKTGIAIAFFNYGKYVRNAVYTEYADNLIDGLFAKIEKRIGNSFATGFSGIGWGIEYLVQNNFVVCEVEQTCKDIDEIVMTTDMRRMDELSLEYGLEGFLHFIMIRLAGAKKRNESRPFDDTYLKDTRRKLLSLPKKIISSDLFNLKQLFINYLNSDSPIYEPPVSTFTKQLCLENEQDILSAKPGLADGLAGKLLQITDNK